MTPVQVELLNMVLMLLVTLTGAAVVGAYAFRNVHGGLMVIGTFIVAIAIIFFSEGVNDAFGAFTTAALFGGTMGAMVGGFVHLLTKDHPRGKEGLTLTLGITFAILLVGAGIGLFSGYDFSGWNGTMSTILMGILILSVIGLVVNFGKVIELVMSLGIIGFFSVYLIVHFNAIKDAVEVATWNDALHISMAVFLDLMNIFIRLLPIILDAMD